jgi:CheY-like chemotaxis protein
MAKEILIADSDMIAQKEFERIFKATDHHLLFTTNDEEALLRGKLFKPDLIIGGKDLCQAVKADRELEHIPFVILLDLFEDLSEMEQTFLHADGMISRPLDEEEILRVVDRLGGGAKEETEEAAIFFEEGSYGKSFADIGKTKAGKEKGFSMNEFGGGEEEIIELVDVVEEPESRMSIDDFALQERVEPIGEISPIESWEKQGAKEEGIKEEEVSLRFEEEVVEKKVSTEDELFEKIEMEEILQKMERLSPSIEKEWPVEKGEKTPVEIAPAHSKADEQYGVLEEFETALQGAVKTEPEEEKFQLFSFEETRQEGLKTVVPEEAPVEIELQELSEEEFPEFFLEELEEELERLEEKESIPGEAAAEAEPETTEEEEISELLDLGVQPSGPMLEEVAPLEELRELEEETPGFIEIPQPHVEETAPPAVRLDRRVEEALSKGMEEMLQDFMTRVLPDITGNIVALTMERIEKTVREVVPDLAEKAIQEELRRLQKEEKDEKG